jgi:hypothetical protein
MPDITAYQENLPDNLKDLSAFVLVGREKLTAVRAEIRAIEKLELAEEVRQQKREEARMLGEALLDAEVRIGELTKRIPKDNSFRGNQWQSNSGVTLADSNTEVLLPQTKEEILADMGFGKMQVSRYETLADNKDLVEQVKAEARETGEIPTRGKVLDLVKARKERQQPQKITEYSYEDIDKRANIAKHYLKHIGELASDFPSREDVECLFQFQPVEMQKDFAETCDKAMQTIRTVKLYYTERVNKYGYEQENP